MSSILDEKFESLDDALAVYGKTVLQIPIPKPPPLTLSTPNYFLDGVAPETQPSLHTFTVRIQYCADGFWRYIREDS